MAPPPRKGEMTQQQRFDVLCKFEHKFHSLIWQWMMHKLEHKDEEAGQKSERNELGLPVNEIDKIQLPTIDLTNLEILDISEDASVFSMLLAEKYKTKRLVSAVRPEIRDNVLVKDNMQVIDIDVTGNTYEQLTALGQFDIIILKEVLYQVKDLVNFFTILQSNLRPNGVVFIVTRPKNPPVPLPNPAMEMWRKMAPSREDVIGAANEVGYKIDCYAASCPITIDKFDWEAILMSGNLPAVKNSKKCTHKEIQDFIKRQSSPLKFEEKIFLFLIWMPAKDKGAQ